MENSYEQGFAFILEAATELAFYDILLNFLAERHPECKLEKRTSDEIYEPFYVVQGPFGTRVIRMNAVGTITQIKNSVHWFQNTCIHAKGKKIPWTVFLCYDTDSYNADITKFYEDDWKNFRKEISKGSRTVKIIDLAASAEIEDVFLLDLHGISQFLGLEEDLKPEDVPNGHKGSARLKQLILKQRQLNRTMVVYHKGERAKNLIKFLDLQKIMESDLLPLYHLNSWIENAFFNTGLKNELYLNINFVVFGVLDTRKRTECLVLDARRGGCFRLFIACLGQRKSLSGV